MNDDSCGVADCCDIEEVNPRIKFSQYNNLWCVSVKLFNVYNMIKNMSHYDNFDILCLSRYTIFKQMPH